MTGHAPDTPFGCTHAWGPETWRGFPIPHICNRANGHSGRHVCACGAWYEDRERVDEAQDA